MPFLGKSGADAVFVAVNTICKIVGRYHTKLGAAIDRAVSDGVITSEQGTTAHNFVLGITTTCAIWELIAGNSGF